MNLSFITALGAFAPLRATQAPVSTHHTHKFKGLTLQSHEETTIERCIPLADIVELPPLLVRRRGLHEDTVKRYANLMRGYGPHEESPLPPPKAVRGHHGKFILIDGFHRIAATRMIGRDWIDLEVITLTFKSDAELRLLAFEANAQHGLPLSAAEHRDWFKAYIKANRFKKPDGTPKSLREIGREFGISHTTVARRLQTHFPRLFERWYANEELSFKTGGLLPMMERNAVRQIEQHFNESLALVIQLEALDSQKADELRGEILRQIEEVAQRCREKGYIDPEF